MNRTTNYMILTVAVVGISLFLWKIIDGTSHGYDDGKGTQTTANKLLPKNAPQNAIMHTLVIDGENSGLSVIDGLRGNGHWILLLKPKDPKHKDLYSFNGLRTLVQYDLNKDGKIDSHDPIFQNLVLADFHPRKNIIRYRFAKDAGVRVIIIDKDHLVDEWLNRYKGQVLQAGTIVMSDGSKRVMHITPIHAKEFHGYSLDYHHD